MARTRLDPTGNEDLGRQIAKLNTMLTELYGADATVLDWSGTTLTATGLITGGTAKIGTGTKTATATAGAATLNKASGVITSEALTTAAGATYTLTITDSEIAAADTVMASLANGTNTQGWLHIESITPAAGSVVIVARNLHASQALNGTVKVSFVSFKA